MSGNGRGDLSGRFETFTKKQDRFRKSIHGWITLLVLLIGSTVSGLVYVVKTVSNIATMKDITEVKKEVKQTSEYSDVRINMLEQSEARHDEAEKWIRDEIIGMRQQINGVARRFHVPVVIPSHQENP